MAESHKKKRSVILTVGLTSKNLETTYLVPPNGRINPTFIFLLGLDYSENNVSPLFIPLLEFVIYCPENLQLTLLWLIQIHVLSCHICQIAGKTHVELNTRYERKSIILILSLPCKIEQVIAVKDSILMM